MLDIQTPVLDASNLTPSIYTFLIVIVMAVISFLAFLLRREFPLSKRPTYLMFLINLSLLVETFWGGTTFMPICPCLVYSIITDLLLVCIAVAFLVNVMDSYLVWRINSMKLGLTAILRNSMVDEGDANTSSDLQRRISRLRRLCRLTSTPGSTLIMLLHAVAMLGLGFALKYLLDFPMLMYALEFEPYWGCTWDSRPYGIGLLLLECVVFGVVMTVLFRRNLRNMRDCLGVRRGILGFIILASIRFTLWIFLAFVIARLDNGLYSGPLVLVVNTTTNFMIFINFTGIPVYMAHKSRRGRYRVIGPSGEDSVELAPLAGDDFFESGDTAAAAANSKLASSPPPSAAAAAASAAAAAVTSSSSASASSASAPPRLSLSSRVHNLGPRSNRVAGATQTLPFEFFVDVPEGQECFRKYLVSEWNSENIVYLIDLESYTRSQDASTRVDVAKLLWTTYFAPNAVSLLNLESAIANRVALAVGKVISGELPPSDDLFAEATKAIRRLLRFDCFPRFRVSQVYREFLTSFSMRTPALTPVAGTATAAPAEPPEQLLTLREYEVPVAEAHTA